MLTLTFLGATGTVTGSKYLLEAGGERLMVDCGLFQGDKELRLRNWNPLPVPPASIQWLLLTHAHLDHVGYIPRLVKDGFRGPSPGVFGHGRPRQNRAARIPDIFRKRTRTMRTGKGSASTPRPSHFTLMRKPSSHSNLFAP